MSATVLHMEGVLDGLIQREFAVRLTRRPGQTEQRFAQKLGGEGEEAPETGDSLEAPVARLEAEVRELLEALHGS